MSATATSEQPKSTQPSRKQKRSQRQNRGTQMIPVKMSVSLSSRNSGRIHSVTDSKLTISGCKERVKL